MRHDMAKTFYERGRSSSPYRYPRQFDMDGLDCVSPTRESMRQHYSWQFSKNKESRARFYNIHRTFKAGVGRLWSEVYAEIRANIHGNTLHEVLFHIRSDVAVNTYLSETGQILTNCRLWSGVVVAEEHFDYFVHPTTGILMTRLPTQSRGYKAADRRADELRRVYATRRDLGPLLQAHRIKGIWYAVELQRFEDVVDSGTDYNLLRDMVLGPIAIHRETGARTRYPYRGPGYVDYDLGRLLQTRYGRKDVYGVRKQQLSHEEMVRYELIIQ